MEPLRIAQAAGLVRVAFGAAMTFAPGFAAQSWGGPLGSRRGAELLTAATGARDLAIGAGTAFAASTGQSARPWLLAGAAGDLADFVYTLRARDEIPSAAAVGISLIAAASTAFSIWLATAVD